MTAVVDDGSSDDAVVVNVEYSSSFVITFDFDSSIREVERSREQTTDKEREKEIEMWNNVT